MLNENQERLIDKVCEILEFRATDPNRKVDMRIAYNSALIMLSYALQENEECLHQFEENP